MKVKDLINLLRSADPDKIVVLSRDAEGNGYSPLAQCDPDANYKDWEVGLAHLTEEDKKAGYTEEDLLNGEPAVVLYPL